MTSFHFEARDWRDPARLRARVHLVVRRANGAAALIDVTVGQGGFFMPLLRLV